MQIGESRTCGKGRAKRRRNKLCVARPSGVVISAAFSSGGVSVGNPVFYGISRWLALFQGGVGVTVD